MKKIISLHCRHCERQRSSQNILISVLLLVSLFAFSTVKAFCSEEISEENLIKASAAYKQGIALFKAKDYDKALEFFNKALEYNPKMTDAYYNTASIYIHQGNIDEAYSSYLKIMKLNPYDYDAVLQAAKIAYNRKSYALAMRYINLIPDDYINYGAAMKIYADSKEMLEAGIKKTERAKITSADETKKVLIDKFNSPAGAAVDSEGNLYIACYGDNSIIKLDKNQKRTVLMKDYLLEGPVGLAIDEFDNLYAANFDGNNIIKITKSGQASIFMDKISKPYFLYIKNDTLYISEQGNNVVVTCSLASGK